MGFLIVIAAIVVLGYIGYEYYQAKSTLHHEPTVLDLVNEVKEDVETVEAKAEAAVTKAKKTTKKVADAGAKTTKKKKPNLNVAK